MEQEGLPEERILALLRDGELEILGAIPGASNATLLVRVAGRELETLAVYKPRRGETPLWDFPAGTLSLREQAAWVLDRVLGWGLVPPTVLRDGPVGPGSVQLWVDRDDEVDILDLPETHPEDLRRVALFDVIANNADRKGGHLLVDVRGRLWSVDHGICFHVEPKLRTVIWVYEGEPVPASLVADVERVLGSAELDGPLSDLLSRAEIDALRTRMEALMQVQRYPSPGPGRPVPWPPW